MIEIYDAVLIGTGPPMLFEGLARARAGERIIFIDQTEELGGSWTCKTLFGYSNIEVGVHLIENRPDINQLIRAILPETEIAQSTGDFGMIAGRRIPMRLARVILYGGIAGRAAFELRGDRIRHAIRHTASATRNLGHPLIYPKRGIAALLRALETELAHRGATFQMDCAIERLTLDDRVTAHTTRGPVNAHHLVMSSRAHAPIETQAPLWDNIPDTTVTTAVLHLENPVPVAPQGYAEIINDAALKRVRNVTPFADPAVPDGQTLLAVQVRQALTDRTPERILAELQRLKLIAPGTTIRAIHYDAVGLNTLPETALQKIETVFGSKVTVLRTVDLSDQKYKAL